MAGFKDLLTPIMRELDESSQVLSMLVQKARENLKNGVSDPTYAEVAAEVARIKPDFLDKYVVDGKYELRAKALADDGMVLGSHGQLSIAITYLKFLVKSATTELGRVEGAQNVTKPKQDFACALKVTLWELPAVYIRNYENVDDEEVMAVLSSECTEYRDLLTWVSVSEERVARVDAPSGLERELPRGVNVVAMLKLMNNTYTRVRDRFTEEILEEMLTSPYGVVYDTSDKESEEVSEVCEKQLGSDETGFEPPGLGVS